MLSFVGDTVLDPFMATGTTSVAAARWGRNSVGCEVDEHYFHMAQRRIREETTGLFSAVEVRVHGDPGRQESLSSNNRLPRAVRCAAPSP
jgi:DNA modification methylase